MKIVLLFTSDVHGAGMEKAASVIHEIRKQEQHVLLIDNGDLIQGTPIAQFAISTKEEIPHPSITQHNYLQYDAAVVGNHEFNYGVDKLQTIMSQSRFPWLSANIVEKGTTTPFFGKPYIIREFNDVRIAVLGLTTQFIPHWESSDHIQSLDFLDPIQTANNWIPYIKKEENTDIIIISYHGGFEKNPDTLEFIGKDNGENQGYALAHIDGIDGLITGHQHLTITSEINNIPVIQAGTGASHIGKLEFHLENQQEHWKITKYHTSLLPTVDARIDEPMIKAIQPVTLLSEKWLNEIIGATAHSMSFEDPMNEVWLTEHPLIEWINRVQMKQAEVSISCTSLLNPNTHGFHDTVSRRDILQAYPFPNSLVVLELTGDDICAALEVSSSFLTLDEQNQVKVSPAWLKPRLLSYNYDMWEGIEYTVNLHKPIGQRVENVTFQGKPLHDQKYLVAMNNYRASGSGGYDMCSHSKVVREIQTDIAELLIQDVQQNQTIAITANQNWKILY